MGVRGPFQRLKKLGLAFGSLRGLAFKRSLNERLGSKMKDLVLRCLDTSIDPYGRHYAPLKHRRGTPLKKTLRMYYGISYAFSSVGWRVLTSVSYAKFQNSGTWVIPARQFIPTRGLPTTWRRELVAQGAAEMKATFR